MDSMKTPTEILKAEHQAVLGKLDALEGAVNDLEHREKVSASLRELTAFFDTEFWVHFDKEEQALFPEFDSFMPRGAGPLAAMIEEHEVLRKTNAVMQPAVASYLDHDDSAETRQTIIQNGMHFIEFLRAHIAKEDSLLFSMAEMHLNPGQNEKVVKLFAAVAETARNRTGKDG